jgi:hypothetical protein
MMMMRISKLAQIAIASLTPTMLMAQFDQSGYPAECDVYEACQNDVCIRISLPLSSITVIEDEGAFYISDSLEGNRLKVGFFASFDEAREFVSSTENLDFHHVLIPNDEVADAFGLNYYPINSFRGPPFPEEITKLGCSAWRYRLGSN